MKIKMVLISKINMSLYRIENSNFIGTFKNFSTQNRSNKTYFLNIGYQNFAGLLRTSVCRIYNKRLIYIIFQVHTEVLNF